MQRVTKRTTRAKTSKRVTIPVERNQKRTKIVCTIGPSSQAPDILNALVREGMNVARLNFSHGDHRTHEERFNLIRTISEETGLPIAVLQDLQGPKIRVGVLPERGVPLAAGEEIVFTSTDPGPAGIRKKHFQITYDALHKDVNPGERILMDDGLLSAQVKKIKGKQVFCTVIDGGTLLSSKGVNFPDSRLTVSPITKKDFADMAFGVKIGVDAIALSFVRSAKEIYDLRYAISAEESKLGNADVRRIMIIAKIEHKEAVKNLDEIIEAADGIMVARGDLGIEMPAETVPFIQKRIVEKCARAAKPVIVATQMLDSLIRHPRPTRAEVSDVANAVIDGADALMLSGETASGAHPVTAVRTMSQIISHAEQSLFAEPDASARPFSSRTCDEAIAEAAARLARDAQADAMLVTTLTGQGARLVSRSRPSVPLFAETDNERTLRQMQFSWGLNPLRAPRCASIEELLARSIGELKAKKEIRTGDRLVIVSGEPVGESGNNYVELRDIR